MRSGIFRRQITDLEERDGGDRKRENGEGGENEGGGRAVERGPGPRGLYLLERDDG